VILKNRKSAVSNPRFV